jgi:hypothetical protein
VTDVSSYSRRDDSVAILAQAKLGQASLTQAGLAQSTWPVRWLAPALALN